MSVFVALLPDQQAWYLPASKLEQGSHAGDRPNSALPAPAPQPSPPSCPRATASASSQGSPDRGSRVPEKPVSPSRQPQAQLPSREGLSLPSRSRVWPRGAGAGGKGHHSQTLLEEEQGHRHFTWGWDHHTFRLGGLTPPLWFFWAHLLGK